ncbi:MAG: hypothetical protein AAGK79_13290 [Pseudomonadota bacterium]
MSVHVQRAQDKAALMGAFAGDPETFDLWEMSKRELVEIALRLTMEDGVDQAAARVREERRVLKQADII